MLSLTKWKCVDNKSPGYWGKTKKEKLAKLDKKYGPDNWMIAWSVNGKLLEFLEICQLYENAYYSYFKRHPETLDDLVTIASDVYDDDPSNTRSGVSYRIQETNRTHIQDIAIRRSMRRLRKRFKGDRLIQVRGHGTRPLGVALAPGQIPFHKPEWISTPDNLKTLQRKAWWLPGSIEDFYQRGKRICIRVKKSMP